MAKLGYVKEYPMTGYLGLGGGVTGRAFPIGGGDEYWYIVSKGMSHMSTNHTGMKGVMGIDVDDDGNIYTAWAKHSGGGCIATKHNKFGDIQWAKQIIVSSDGSGGTMAVDSESGHTGWQGGMVRSPYNGFLIFSLVDHQPPAYGGWGDIVHVALNSSGVEQWSVRHDCGGIRTNWNQSNNANNSAGYFEKKGQWETRGTRMVAPKNSSYDLYHDGSMTLKDVKYSGNNNATEMDWYMCFKASDGSKVNSSDYGTGKWEVNNGNYADRMTANQISLNWGASATSGYIARGAAAGYMNYTQCSLNSSGAFGSGGIANFGRLENTYPNHANYQGHWNFHAFPVNSYQAIVAGAFNRPSPSRPAVSIAFISNVSSGTCTDRMWSTDHGLNLEDMHYSYEESRLYGSMHRRTASSNYKTHAVFARSVFDASTKSFDWAKGVEVQVNGNTINAKGGRIFVKDGKFYAAVYVMEGLQNPLLMVWDSVNGPTNGTYGEGTTGAQDTQIIIYDMGGTHGWTGGGNAYFGNGGTAGKHGRSTGTNYYGSNIMTHTDDSGTTDATYTPQKLIDGNTGAASHYEGFSKGATDRAIAQDT